MKPSDEVFELAVPHEAGHVLVAYSFRVTVQQIAYRIRSESSGRIISVIAAPSCAPHELAEQERQTHCVIAAAGMAGELVATGRYDPANLSAKNPDKKMVSMLSHASITDFVPAAQEIIEKNRKAFDLLCSTMRERYPEIREQIVASGQPGRYPLLDKEELDEILSAVTTRQHKVHTQLGRAAVQIFAANDRMNQILIEHLDPTAWRAKPPGKARTIAAIFTHMHNVRCKWVRLTAPHLKVPPQLHRAHCTPQQARAGLAESAARCGEMLAEALGGGGGRVEKFRRDGWARPWPVGLEMLCYMLSHEAHHRGQVCMLAHQLGFPLPNEVAYGLWNWEKLWKECGSSGGPGYDSFSR